MKPYTELPSDSAAQPTQMAEAMRNLQHAVTQSHDAIFVADQSGVITRVNPAFEKLSGYGALEIVGMPQKTDTPRESDTTSATP